MSRCFPYPPPGYFPRRTVDEALIESTKLQRETKKDKEDRHQKKAKKERKREKKEKKREKKEKREEKEKGKDVANEIGDTELNDKKGQKGDVNLKGGHSQRISKDEAEQLERSDLTEEHGQPIYSQNSCHSSDSTQNSNKRKRHTSLSSGSSNHGNIIRLRLPLTKHKELEASLTKEQNCSERLPLPKDKGPAASLSKERGSSMRLPLLKHEEPKASLSKEPSSSMRLPLLKCKEPEASLNKEKSCSIPRQREPEISVRREQNCSIWMPLSKQRAPEASQREESCSTSGGVDLLAQQKYEVSGQCIEAPPFFSMRTDTLDQKLNPRPDQQLLCSTSNVPKIVVHDDANASKGSRSSKKQRAESQYKALVEDWVAPLLQAEQTDLDDQEWLFQKHGDRQESKRHKDINYELRYGSWPCAQYLPEADLYALPYTVPF